jgi:hypothetical protein
VKQLGAHGLPRRRVLHGLGQRRTVASVGARLDMLPPGIARDYTQAMIAVAGVELRSRPSAYLRLARSGAVVKITD